MNTDSHGRARLTPAAISGIRADLAGGARQVDVAAKYEVSQATVSRVKNHSAPSMRAGVAPFTVAQRVGEMLDELDARVRRSLGDEATDEQVHAAVAVLLASAWPVSPATAGGGA